MVSAGHRHGAAGTLQTPCYPKVPRAPSSAVSCMGLGSPGHTGSNAGRDQQHEPVGGKAHLSPTSPGSLSLGRDPQSSSKHLVNKFQVTKNTLAKGMMCALVTWLLSSHSAVGSAALADEEGSEGPVTGLCPSQQQPRAFWGSRELALAVTGPPRCWRGEGHTQAPPAAAELAGASGRPKRTDGSGWAGRDDTSVNHFRATVPKRSTACAALLPSAGHGRQRRRDRAPHQSRPFRTANPPRLRWLRAGPPVSPPRWGQGRKAAALGAWWDAQSGAAHPAQHPRPCSTAPGSPAAQGLQRLVIPFRTRSTYLQTEFPRSQGFLLVDLL